MKLKNIKELQLRANWHAKQDHIRQGTYGDGECNGFVEFKGCAIGCLATPHGKNRLKAFIKSLGWQDGLFGEWYFSEEDDTQIPRLKKEFGIVPELARAAEAMFEGCETHGEAIEFIPKFAKCLSDGTDLRSDQVVKAWNRITDSYEVKGETIYTYSYQFDPEVREEFLNWLRERCGTK